MKFIRFVLMGLIVCIGCPGCAQVLTAAGQVMQKKAAFDNKWNSGYNSSQNNSLIGSLYDKIKETATDAIKSKLNEPVDNSANPIITQAEQPPVMQDNHTDSERNITASTEMEQQSLAVNGNSVKAETVVRSE